MKNSNQGLKLSEILNRLLFIIFLLAQFTIMYICTITEHLLNAIPFIFLGEWKIQAAVYVVEDIKAIRIKLFGA